MKELLKIKNWLASRTLRVFGILGLTGTLDAAFFEGNVGMFILQLFLTATNALPFVNLSAEQGLSTLVVLIAGVGSWLRAITGESLENK